MKVLGVYRLEFAHAIDILAGMLAEYEDVTEQFKESGGDIIVEHTNKAGATNIAKNPLYLAMEGLRKSILDYLRELGMTPTAIKRINDNATGKERASPLSVVMKELIG